MSYGKYGAALAVVAALCLSAFGAASASALPLSPEHCITGAGTGTGPFPDSKCWERSPGGAWEWARFENTGIVIEPNPVAMSSVIGGVKFQVSCTGVEGGGEMTAAGEEEVHGSGIVLTYIGCTVAEPAGKGCEVRAGTEVNGKLKTKSLKSVTTRPEAEKYRSKYSPTTGSTLMSIEVNGCSSETLNGTKELTGSATSVSSNGRLQEFTKTSGSELKLAGQALTLVGSNELKSSSAEGGAIRVAP
jgi:hypothetical protein